jgi:hypothetical protein
MQTKLQQETWKDAEGLGLPKTTIRHYTKKAVCRPTSFCTEAKMTLCMRPLAAQKSQC